MPELLGKVEERAVVRGEMGGIEAAGEAGGDDAELLLEAAELLGKLRFGVRLGHGLGEAIEEEIEVAREGEAVSGGVEEALQEAELVGFRPDPVEFEGRGLQIVVFFVGIGGGRRRRDF